MVMISHFNATAMRKPKEIYRTTLDKCFDGETALPISGIYIIAYMGKVLYVGKAYDFSHRFRWHLRVGDYQLDNWLRGMVFDFQNIRLDLLIAPDNVDYERWIREVEAMAITKFKPLFNNLLN